jgi:hypothetical protein
LEFIRSFWHDQSRLLKEAKPKKTRLKSQEKGQNLEQKKEWAAIAMCLPSRNLICFWMISQQLGKVGRNKERVDAVSSS